MRPRFVARNFLGKTRACPRKIERIVTRPHYPQQRWTHECQKGNECGDRISGKPEKQASVAFAEQKRFTRFHGHAPKIDLRPDLTQRFAHEIMLTDRDATSDDHGVLLR